MKKSGFLFILIVFVLSGSRLYSQKRVIDLSKEMFDTHERIFLAPFDGWIFKAGKDSSYLNSNDLGWTTLNPTKLSPDMENQDGRLEGWFRLKFKLDESLEGVPLFLNRDLWAATDVYIDGDLIQSFGSTKPYETYNPILKYPVKLDLEPNREYTLSIHFVNYESIFAQREIRLKPNNLKSLISFSGPAYNEYVDRNNRISYIFGTLGIGLSGLLFFLFWYLCFLNPDQQIFKLIAWLITFVLLTTISIFFNSFFEISYPIEKIRFLLMINLQAVTTVFGLFILEWMLIKQISKWSLVIFGALVLTNLPAHLYTISLPFGLAFTIMLMYYGRLLYNNWTRIKGSQWAVVVGVILATIATLFYISIHKYLLDFFNEFDKPIISLANLILPICLLAYVSSRLNESLKEVYEESQKVLKVNEEKRELLENQNMLLEQQVTERTKELNQSLENLKSTQTQLIHSEKMASLGELTAGIAHEIQNPLNFVNNFSDLNSELLNDLKEAISQNDQKEIEAIYSDLKENESKINHHGKRAEEIVKSMLQHSRGGDGEKQLIDINSLADEYLRLSFHGLRAKDKNGPTTRFNAEFKTEFDPDLPKVNVVPQDIGRVLLNLINNAFQAVKEVKQPEVIVSTQLKDNQVEILVKDNGPGIPDEIKDKIFQPFFTTKATGEGTGLGLSMSYDIVTKGHAGELNVESKQGMGTTFIINLPIV